MKASIEAGGLVVAYVDERMLPRFDAEEEMEANVEALKH